MKVFCPHFRQSIEWRKLTWQERAGKPWKYVLLQDIFIEVETGLRDRYDCFSGDVVYMTLLPHGIVMRKGYAWNGNTASPDKLFGRWLLVQSLPHDGFFQFSGAIGFPRAVITLPWVNWLYLQMSPAWAGWAYYAGLVSGSWALWGHPPQNGEYVECRALHQPEPV
jgi:hypothetical protein